MKAFATGRAEADSVCNLMMNIHPNVAEELAYAVKTRGMVRFLEHSVLAKDVMNRSFSSGISGYESWKDYLRNDESCALESWPCFILRAPVSSPGSVKNFSDIQQTHKG